MQSKNILAVIIIGYSFLLATNAKATILFQDSFDSSPDWNSAEDYTTQANAIWPYTWSQRPGGPTQPPPQGWYSYRSAPPAWQHEHTFVLNSEGARGGSGKGVTYNIEAKNPSYWAGGGLDLYFGSTGYQELYSRAWYKFDTDNTFHWAPITSDATAQYNGSLAKVQRISRYFGNGGVPTLTDNPQAFLLSDGTQQAPTFYPDVYQQTYAPYNTPPLSNSVHLTAGRVFSNTLGDVTNDERYSFAFPTDGQWHMYEFRVKMNSAPGVADGEWEVWIDGGSQHAKGNGVTWVAAGDSLTPGWNWINAFDNFYLNMTGLAWQGTVMKVFMDDVVVYTPINSSDSLWTSSPQDGRLPLDYVIPGAAGAATYGSADFISFILNWYKAGTISDFNSDTIVNAKDLGIMMSKWN